MITEPNCIIFELILEMLVRGISEPDCFQISSVSVVIESNPITESLGLPYRNVLGIIFGNFGRGIAEPKLSVNGEIML